MPVEGPRWLLMFGVGMAHFACGQRLLVWRGRGGGAFRHGVPCRYRNKAVACAAGVARKRNAVVGSCFFGRRGPRVTWDAGAGPSPLCVK